MFQKVDYLPVKIKNPRAPRAKEEVQNMSETASKTYYISAAIIEEEGEHHYWDNNSRPWLFGEPYITKRDALAAIIGAAREGADINAGGGLTVEVELSDHPGFNPRAHRITRTYSF